VQPCFVACGAQRRIARSLRWQPRRCDAAEKSWTRKTACHSVQELNSIGSCMRCWGVKVHGGCASRMSLLCLGLVARNQPGQVRLLNVAFQHHEVLKSSFYNNTRNTSLAAPSLVVPASVRIRGAFAGCRSPKFIQVFTVPAQLFNIASKTVYTKQQIPPWNCAVVGLSFTPFARIHVHLSGCYGRSTS